MNSRPQIVGNLLTAASGKFGHQ
ncbi:hypothetical protein KPSB59_3150004 [Klebsiella quasipneumoniae subsp. quasipneumoniae]|nr:hypothetical protein KPSB59_3150004 [Klebsiella quasipneumoniae subsp. quasipneumoniae]